MNEAPKPQEALPREKATLEKLKEAVNQQEILALTHELLKQKNKPEDVFMATSEALNNAGETALAAQYMLAARSEYRLRMDAGIAKEMTNAAGQNAQAAKEMKRAANDNYSAASNMRKATGR